MTTIFLAAFNMKPILISNAKTFFILNFSRSMGHSALESVKKKEYNFGMPKKLKSTFFFKFWTCSMKKTLNLAFMQATSTHIYCTIFPVLAYCT